MRTTRLTSFLTPVLAAILAIGCGAAVPEQDSSGQADVRYSSRVHKMPVSDARPTPYSAPAGAHLTYYGGRVNGATKVVQVLWGTGSYLSNVSSTGTPSMATFYQQMLSKTTLPSWLDSEYNTVNPTGTKTNQHINAGSFQQQVTITPSTTATTVDDTAIQAELTAQIAAGHLPAPALDASGNPVTYYAVFFPPGITITQGTSSSCVAGGFCAFHGTVASTSAHNEYYYGVHPDMQPGSGCATGCGNSTTFGNYTSVASHELVEMMTDAEVGIAPNLAPPLAWYDNTNGEIGDICNAQQGTVAACDGQSYVYQLEFSNAQANCIGISPSCGTTTNDFSISASPSSGTVAPGGSTSSTISTATTSGSAQTVSLSVSGAPAGVTASLSPTSVSSGQSSTLSITTTTSAAAGTYTLTVTGSATSGSHSTTYSLTISGGTGGGSGITNGGFETGSLSGWTASGAAETVVSSGCHGGTYCAQLGSTAATNGDSSIAQTFTAPSGTTGIAFWYKETCPDSVTYDWATATLKDNTAGTTATLLAKICTSNSWTQVTGSITAGHSYTLTLTSHDDNYSSDPTYTLYDDVSLTSSAPPPPPPSGGITNGGFETGSFSGWTVSGTTSITTTSHSGSYAAMAGSTAATNGDSSIVQTFTAPSGTTKVSLYYANNCPDTVTYDWVTVTLKDNTAGTTATVVPKTCASSYTWTNVTSAVTAGHSYTLTLTNHDDNYSADPTYTLFDDVVVQ